MNTASAATAALARCFTPADAIAAVRLAEAFIALGADATSRSRASYAAREGGAADTCYWSKVGIALYAPAPTKKQKNLAWLDIATRVAPGSLRLNIAAAGCDVAVVEWGRDADKSPIRNVLFESSPGAAARIAAAN